MEPFHLGLALKLGGLPYDSLVSSTIVAQRERARRKGKGEAVQGEDNRTLDPLIVAQISLQSQSRPVVDPSQERVGVA